VCCFVHFFVVYQIVLAASFKIGACRAVIDCDLAMGIVHSSRTSRTVPGKIVGRLRCLKDPYIQYIFARWAAVFLCGKAAVFGVTMKDRPSANAEF
jgi:hypothetical protein